MSLKKKYGEWKRFANQLRPRSRLPGLQVLILGLDILPGRRALTAPVRRPSRSGGRLIAGPALPRARH